MIPIPVFVDSDVVISSLLSSKGAAHLLVHDRRLACYVSDFSTRELLAVTDELRVSRVKLTTLLKTYCRTVNLPPEKIWLSRMRFYTLDENDAHIVAGAHAAKARFLITYNVKHFYAEKIRDSIGIIVLTPAFLLQYLRSLN